ncbi:hypothetical protein PanWU01x14_224010 [Parasponia andersonii]|uniref:Uncharacterized protein n=1 Tax=Parasponia andersonii TaxID=3476 RepID=A0A2P5BND9_PARAD|nr:hypothetical protein PanWU01x14_224010 [Parasponia andersonii]
MSLKHLVREFRKTHELFPIAIVNGDRSIKVLERNRGRDYEVSFKHGGAVWLLDMVELVLRDEGKGQFFRKFKGSSYLLLLEVKYNKWGKFLQLVKLQNGVESKEISQKQEEVTKFRKAIRDNTVIVEGEFSTVKHNHSLAVVIYKESIEEGWRDIKEELSRRLQRNVKISVIYTDRAAIVGVQVNQKEEDCFDMSTFYLYKCKSVRIVIWQQLEHCKNCVWV